MMRLMDETAATVDAFQGNERKAIVFDLTSRDGGWASTGLAASRTWISATTSAPNRPNRST